MNNNMYYGYISCILQKTQEREGIENITPSSLTSTGKAESAKSQACKTEMR